MTRGLLAKNLAPDRIAARWQTTLRFATLALLAGYVVFVGALWLAGAFDVEALGYPGVWLFSLIGASSIVLPIPGLAAVCAAASPAIGLNPALLGVVAASAEAIGELTGYLAGVTGGSFIQKNRHYPRVQQWVIKRGGLLLFVMATFPNPFFDVVGMAAGSVRYPIRRFLLVTYAGKAIKSTWVAYGCYYGISAIQRLVG
ncbi:MAG: VTT domain-containing protein [Chloroflexi bacterium]|nr:VTT domain-containing protein [Chloroflexota bacterium]